MTRVPRQFNREIDSVVSNYTGPPGEPILNLTTGRLHMQDGQTKGGVPHALVGDTKDAPLLTYTAAGSGAVQRTLQARFSEVVSVTDFGAKPDYSDSTAAIQAAFNYANSVSGHVYFPPSLGKAYAISSTVQIGPNVAGFGGDNHERCSIGATDFNAPFFHWPVPNGRALSQKRVQGMACSVQWSKSSPNYTASRFLSIDGDTGGFSYSKFLDLAFFGIYSGIEINTNYITTSFGHESESGWNVFDGLLCNVGSQGIYPDSAVRWLQGSSTGNYFGKLKGAVNTAFIDYQGGAGFVVGDITVVGEQIGKGRVMNIVAGTVYRHNISITGIQTDAGATETLAINSGTSDVVPTMVKIQGSAPAGSTPWAGLAPVRHSRIGDLGENGWDAGGVVATGAETVGTAKQIALWNVTTAGDGTTVVDLIVEGIVNGVDVGLVIQRFYIVSSVTVGNLKVYSDAAVVKSLSSGTTAPTGFLVLSTGISGNAVQFAVAYTPQQTNSAGSSLHTSIFCKGGAVKVQRVAGGVNA